MFEDENSVDEDEIVTAEELTDFAFGMFTIFAAQSLDGAGKQLFSAVEESDAKQTFELLLSKFITQYPMLGESLEMFGSVDDILSFYRYGESILPSRTLHSYWIWQIAPGVDVDACSCETAGKWLIFLPSADVDEAWIKIRDATIAGTLGVGAKVSTARIDEDSHDDDKKVIYVFTKNWEDKDDVMRVRDTLKSFGFVDRIGYKRNLDTYAGEYREKGKRVTYYSV